MRSTYVPRTAPHRRLCVILRKASAGGAAVAVGG